MEKFGNIIDETIPVLLCFYSEANETSMHMTPVLRELVTVLGNSVKAVKIDVEKNKELTNALKISGLPTIIVYKNRELVWRGEGFYDSSLIAFELSKYI